MRGGTSADGVYILYTFITERPDGVTIGVVHGCKHHGSLGSLDDFRVLDSNGEAGKLIRSSCEKDSPPQIAMFRCSSRPFLRSRWEQRRPHLVR